jgi:hypothetical protein
MRVQVDKIRCHDQPHIRPGSTPVTPTRWFRAAWR